MGRRPRLYLIDGSSYIFRAFYAIRQYLSNSQGLPTNAIYGFARMLLKVLREEKPDYLAIAFDPPGPSFRNAMYPAYKANRPPMPEDLSPQIPYIHRLVEAFNIPLVMEEGYEADDLLGTLARRAEADGFDVTIVTGDKDFCQVVTEHIRLLDTMKDQEITPETVKARFGVEPGHVIEVMGLMGDATDNIPGVPGVGEKTAVKLIQEFGDIENVLRHVDAVKGKKLQENLAVHGDDARLSRKLCILKTDMPAEVKWDELLVCPPDAESLRALLAELEFKTLLVEMSEAEGREKKVYQTVLDEKVLSRLVESLRRPSGFALDVETSSKEPVRANLVGISVALVPGDAYYIPLRHLHPGAPEQLAAASVLATLRPVLEDPAIPKYGQNIKYDMIVLAGEGIELRGVTFDTMIASYLLNPSRRTHNLEELALEHLNYKMTSYEDVAGKGAKQKTFDQVPIDVATFYSAEDADITLQLTKLLEPHLRKHNLEHLFREIELPLIPVLADMERRGVKLAVNILERLSRRLNGELEALMREIYEMAGEEFNVNSPPQLRSILFEKLGLSRGKRTKTGYSTDVSVLEALALEHPLPAKVLEYRQLTKLQSTYIDALPKMVNPATGRIHTSFNQTVTATGRLSSSDPNLQNIPIRTELGREIRAAFVAERGHRILSADYSQIELRILAHISGDGALIEAFRQGEDIHTRTACEVFGLTPEAITPEMRRTAKLVNFGIIYGISAFGLARDLKVSREGAQSWINSYFARYTGVKRYVDDTVARAHQDGYVTTLFKRVRYLPDLKSKTPSVRQFAERTAINTPIQGTAADLIKIAMIRIARRLRRENLLSYMILQVHDELVFEVPEEEVDAMRALVREEMEGVTELAVPIVVDVQVGSNWNEAH